MSVVGIGSICVGVVGFLNHAISAPLRALFILVGFVALPIGLVPDAWSLAQAHQGSEEFLAKVLV